MTALTDRDRQILDFAGRTYRQAGVRANALRAELGLNETGLALALNRLINNPAARAEYPTLLGRLDRQRNSRAARRLVAR